MFELKSLTYEEARAEHFKGLMKKMQRKIDWWQDKKRHALGQESMLSRSHLECCEAGMQYSYYNDALKALENQPKWISVEERLPPYNKDVLVYRPRMAVKIVVTQYEGFYGEDDEEWHEGWSHWGFDIRNNLCITHWMPLPEPPKEDA